jgi:transcriptional regulator with XRE-family HTH domain
MTPEHAVHLLLKSGWTQIDLALEVGTSQPTIHRIKSGANRRGVPFELGTALIALAEALPRPEQVDAAAQEQRAP